jgi:hypothetical protein
MPDEDHRAQMTTGELDQMVIGHQPDRFELDEAIAWRDRFIAWQTDRMRGRECTEEQIEAMARKALDMPYAFWIHAMPRRPGHLAICANSSAGGGICSWLRSWSRIARRVSRSSMSGVA